jgi:hypothetical protein
MSDAHLRKLQRQYVQGLLPAKNFLAALRREGAHPIWDWMAGNTSFYDLPLRDQVVIFGERWPAGGGPQTPVWALEVALEGTAKFNNQVVWLDAGPDAPTVGEVLAETLGTFSYYYGLGKSPVEWISFEDFVATEVAECQHLIAILNYYHYFR